MIPSRPSVGGRGIGKANGARISARSARRSVQAPASTTAALRPSSKPVATHLTKHQHQHADYEHIPIVYGIPQDDVVVTGRKSFEEAPAEQSPELLALPFTVPPSDGHLGAAALVAVAAQQQQLQRQQQQLRKLEVQLQQRHAAPSTSDVGVQSSPTHAGLHSHSSSVDSFASLMVRSAAEAAPGTTTINIGSIPIVLPVATALVSIGGDSKAVAEAAPAAATQHTPVASSHALTEFQEDEQEQEEQSEQGPHCIVQQQQQQEQQQSLACEQQQQQQPAKPVFKSKLRADCAEFVPGRAYSASLDSLHTPTASTSSIDGSCTSSVATPALTIYTSAAPAPTPAAAASAAAEQAAVPATPASSAASSFASLPRPLSCKDCDTVTVSARSSVKDAAGAVAKVLERRGTCMLMALRRRSEGAAETTHVAAKTLAVSRFYINTAMGGSSSSGSSIAAMQEVTFVPFQRPLGPHGAVDPDSFGFVVFKTAPGDLEAALPAASGQSAQLALPAAATSAAAAAHAAGAAAEQQAQQQGWQVLKAAAGTDVNKLSNAIIHHVLERGRAVLQLAGAGACHNATKALVKARARLASKFEVGMAAAASFATEDTSGALGRSTVFLRLDVVRCALGGPGGRDANAIMAAAYA